MDAAAATPMPASKHISENPSCVTGRTPQGPQDRRVLDVATALFVYNRSMFGNTPAELGAGEHVVPAGELT